jgi:hypothetical protein
VEGYDTSVEFVKQLCEVPFQNFWCRDFENRGVELHDIATPEFVKAEKPTLNKVQALEY